MNEQYPDMSMDEWIIDVDVLGDDDTGLVPLLPPESQVGGEAMKGGRHICIDVVEEEVLTVVPCKIPPFGVSTE